MFSQLRKKERKYLELIQIVIFYLFSEASFKRDLIIALYRMRVVLCDNIHKSLSVYMYTELTFHRLCKHAIWQIDEI